MSKSSHNPIPQAGAIPVRLKNDRVEYCLITSTRSQRWVFPKGMIEDGDSLEETARKESYEEAGLLGEILPDPVGVYEYSKSGKQLLVTLFLLKVERAEKDWEEAFKRERRWVEYKKANALLPHDRLKELLDVAHQKVHAMLLNG